MATSTQSAPPVPLARLVRRLRDEIHANLKKENPHKSGQLSRLVGDSIKCNPYVKGYWQYDAWRAGWNSPPNDKTLAHADENLTNHEK
jgi:hypothetical protein